MRHLAAWSIAATLATYGLALGIIDAIGRRLFVPR